MFYGYFTLSLLSKGFNESEIGLICAFTPIVALLSNPIWNIFSKNANSNRKIMRVITVIEGIFIILFTQVTTIEVVAVLTCLISMVGTPFYTLHDGFCATFAKAYKKDYTKIRFIGSIAYLAGTLFAALILNLFADNYNILLYTGGTIFILITLFFIFIRPIDLNLIEDGKEVKRDFKKVLTNKTFIFYMSVYFLVVTVAFTAYNYVGMYFTKYLELSSSNWSLIFGGYLLCEFILLFFFSRKKVKMNENIIWVIISILYPLRSILFFFDLPLPLTIIAAMFRGISYGLVLYVNIKCVEKICGIENITAAYFIMAIFTAIIQTVANFTFGNLISSVGYPTFFLIVGLVGLTGAIINLIYQFKNKFQYNIVKKEFD
jgi:predicted MFS family arabinose efflux permease